MIPGLLHRGIVSIRGIAVCAHVAMVLVKNMDSVAANVTVQERYHFDVYLSCLVITID